MSVQEPSPSNSPASGFDARAATWDEDPRKVARAHAIAAAIIERLGTALPSQINALEYGAGTGMLSFVLAEQLAVQGGNLHRVILADTSSGMRDVAGERLAAKGLAQSGGRGPDWEVRDLDLARDGIPDERFHLVYSSMTLHHIPDSARAVTQMAAMLEPAGVLCIADLDAEDGSFHGGRTDIHHGFAPELMQRMFASAGLGEVRIAPCFRVERESASYDVLLSTGHRVR